MYRGDHESTDRGRKLLRAATRWTANLAAVLGLLILMTALYGFVLYAMIKLAMRIIP